MIHHPEGVKQNKRNRRQSRIQPFQGRNGWLRFFPGCYPGLELLNAFGVWASFHTASTAPGSDRGALVSYPAAPHVGCRRHQLESARFAVAALARCRAGRVEVLELGY